jgi:hypothetical protein
MSDKTGRACSTQKSEELSKIFEGKSPLGKPVLFGG